jgi:SAM-dependent methyltransferase
MSSRGVRGRRSKGLRDAPGPDACNCCPIPGGTTGSGRRSVWSVPESPRWDAIADTYVGVTGDNLDPATSALLGLVGQVRGLRVLDMATGAGRFARSLASAGAEVVAIDIAADLLSRAAQREIDGPLGIRYEQGDAAAPATLLGESFDGVACNYGLSDIDDLDGALGLVERVLPASGWFAFSILHPCFPGWPSAEAPSSWPPGSGYFNEGLWFADNAGFRRTAGANHRTLSTYVNHLSAHGLWIEALAEPAMPPEWSAAAPHADGVPIFLAARCRRH